MSSQEVAAYLYEVGSGQRKLEYCRQIMASNQSFTPSNIFSFGASQAKGTLTKGEFTQTIKTMQIGCSEQELELIFGYFQTDGKNYLSLDEFTALIVPLNDPSIQTLINRRKYDQFTLDYSLRYCLQKFFFQIIENQVKLQLMCKFTFENRTKEEKKLKNRRLDSTGLKQFLAVHGKYPDSSMTNFILRQMTQNKGQNKRNKLIVEYIIQYNEKYKLTPNQLPKVVNRQPSTLLAIKAKFQKQIEKDKQNKSFANNSSSKNKYSELSNYSQVQATNPNILNKINQVTNSQPKQNVLSSLSEVEMKIKSLMSEISIKGSKNNSISKYSKTQQAVKTQKSLQDQIVKDSFIKEKKDTQSINDPVKSIRQEIKKQKQLKNYVKEDNFVRKPKPNVPKVDLKGSSSNRVSFQVNQQREMTDRQRFKQRLDFDAGQRNSQNLTDRYAAQRVKRTVQDSFDNESNSSSQVVLRPKARVANPSQLFLNSQKIKQYKTTINQEADGRKRSEYLKSLIEDKQDRKSYREELKTTK